jgi:hypothetical protein
MMHKLTRRRAIATGAALAVATALPGAANAAEPDVQGYDLTATLEHPTLEALAASPPSSDLQRALRRLAASWERIPPDDHWYGARVINLFLDHSLCEGDFAKYRPDADNTPSA